MKTLKRKVYDDEDQVKKNKEYDFSNFGKTYVCDKIIIINNVD